jgi:outer membrane biosynthesis protein TonB
MSKQLESILSRATSATPKPITKPAAETVQTAEVIKVPAEKPKAVQKPEPKQEPQKPLQAHVPASVARAVNIRAAEEGDNSPHHHPAGPESRGHRCAGRRAERPEALKMGPRDLVVAIIGMLVGALAMAQYQAKPRSFDECILKHLSGTSNKGYRRRAPQGLSKSISNRCWQQSASPRGKLSIFVPSRPKTGDLCYF